MDIEKKVQILRACSSKKGNRCSSCPAFGKGDRNCLRNTMRDAAISLSAQQAENEKMRSELERVKRERDAAVDCCSGYCASCLFVKDCAKHDMNDAAPTRWYYGDCEDWEWRGWKEG